VRMSETGTAAAPMIFALPGPSAVVLYAPMPAPCSVVPQSRQFTEGTCEPFKNLSEVCRHEPRFLRSHHGGSVGAAALSVTTNSRPVTSAIGVSSTNDSTSCSLPAFTLQANVLFMTPPSARQWSQRRFKPGVAAEAADEISRAAS